MDGLGQTAFQIQRLDIVRSADGSPDGEAARSRNVPTGTIADASALS